MTSLLWNTKSHWIRKPDHSPALLCLAGAYNRAGRLEEGRAVAAKVLKMNPGYYIEKQPFLPFKYKTDIEAARATLRKMGIPDKPPLPLPDKPFIAVLPFVNMSDDSKKEHFSDWISEDIITALSKVPRVSRNPPT